MKQSIFITVLTIVALAIAIGIYVFVFGNPANFKDGAGHTVPLNLLGTIYTGGPLVALLIMLSLMDVAIIFERSFSLRKASGKRAISNFFSEVVSNLEKGNYDEAIAVCDNQRGSVANVIKAALTRYKELAAKGEKVEAEKQLLEVQRSIEEASMLETPLLEKNLITLSTIASIATMVGLLGTVIGMIRAFSALAQAGAPDAIQLATGISEALINTAGGLITAIMGIVAYNFFVNKVDNFTYMVDEAGYNVIQILKTK
jgi:biopolymer transport protein ExbB